MQQLDHDKFVSPEINRFFRDEKIVREWKEPLLVLALSSSLFLGLARLILFSINGTESPLFPKSGFPKKPPSCLWRQPGWAGG
jgi:hypothetical protein